jgi:hypothetical protein
VKLSQQSAYEMYKLLDCNKLQTKERKYGILKLAPYKEAPALKICLKARQAKVVNPPADSPATQRRCPSTIPVSALTISIAYHIHSSFLIICTEQDDYNLYMGLRISHTRNVAQLQQSFTSTTPHCPKSLSRYSLP